MPPPFDLSVQHLGWMGLGVALLNALLMGRRARRFGASPGQQRRVVLWTGIGLGLPPVLAASGAPWGLVLLALVGDWMALAAWVFLFGGAETLARLKLLRTGSFSGPRSLEDPRLIRLLVTVCLLGAALGLGAIACLSGTPASLFEAPPRASPRAPRAGPRRPRGPLASGWRRGTNRLRLSGRESHRVG